MVLVRHLRDVCGGCLQMLDERRIIEVWQRHIGQFAVPSDGVRLPLVVPVGEILTPQLRLPHVGGDAEPAPELGVQFVR